MDDARARDLLEGERARLATIHDGEEVTRVEGQVADAGAETADRSRDFGALEDLERELAEIEDAFRRLDEGTYGRCAVCGNPIPDERLEANPTARYDIEHQRAVEAGRIPG